jgi:hypothetical protein
VLEGVGAAFDRKLGHGADPGSQPSAEALIQRMKRSIDEKTREHGDLGRVAPHCLKLRIEWGTHSNVPAEALKELEHELLAAAIDHINDSRYRTLAPVRIETITDIFTKGVTIEPTFAEREADMAQLDQGKSSSAADGPKRRASEVEVTARIRLPGEVCEKKLTFKPGGRRLNAGRAIDNDLCLNHPSVSKIHAALVMNRDGALIITDTGSTNGTFINGHRIAYGEAREVESGDVLGFGEVEVRLRWGGDQPGVISNQQSK